MMKVLCLAMGLAVSTVFFAGCGGGAVGDACGAEGAEGECDDTGVCGKTDTDALQCLAVCQEKTDCPSGTDCEGVEGTTIKGCRPKAGKK